MEGTERGVGFGTGVGRGEGVGVSETGCNCVVKSVASAGREVLQKIILVESRTD